MINKDLHQSQFLRIFNSIFAHKYFPIIALICINLVIGSLIVTDYGESWDEHLRYRYAEKSINAYKGITGNLKDEKGPFFVMLGTVTANLIFPLQEDWLISDARHYINFFAFQLGLFFFYRLTLRFTNKWAAFGGTLLFNTQPLLWGHAFLNPKDLPFMVFFIASIDSGFAMADSRRFKKFTGQPGTHLNNSALELIISEWTHVTSSIKWLFIAVSIIGLIAITGLLFSQSLIRVVIENQIIDVYRGDTTGFLQIIFNQIAKHRSEISVEYYIQKAWQLYLKIALYTSISLIFFWILTSVMIFSETCKYLWVNEIKPTLKTVLNTFLVPSVIIAGIFLGMTSSIRTIGPAAGGLVILYIIAKYKNRSSQLIFSYILIGAITTYLLWPGLWGAPIENFIDSLSTASDFPWGGKVLFRGQLFTIGTQPRSYLPVLLSLQFTATALVMIIYGLIISIINIYKRKHEWTKVAIISLWFFVPVSLVVIIEPKIYDNFRHFLFISPPLFIFAATGLQNLFYRAKRPAIQVIIILMLVLPNIFSLIRLHPYQYVYYNIFTHGVGGAFREFEMDYWGTSYREAAEYLNQIAPPYSRIIVYGAPHLVEPYARADLEIEKFKSNMEIDPASQTFAIISSRYEKDIYTFPESEVIYQVGKDGAVFTVVKDLKKSYNLKP